MFFWKLYCERACNVLLKTDTWEGSWCLKRIEMEPHKQWEETLIFTWSSKFNWSSLLREKCAKELPVLFLLILPTPMDSCQFGGSCSWEDLLFLLDHAASTDLSLVFSIELDCLYPDNKEWNHPKEVLIPRYTTPFSYLCSFPAPSGQS